MSLRHTVESLYLVDMLCRAAKVQIFQLQCMMGITRKTEIKHVDHNYTTALSDASLYAPIINFTCKPDAQNMFGVNGAIQLSKAFWLCPKWFFSV